MKKFLNLIVIAVLFICFNQQAYSFNTFGNNNEGYFVKTGSLEIDIKSPQFVSVTKLKDGQILYANGINTAIYDPKTKIFKKSGNFLISVLIAPDSGILLDNGKVFFAGSIMEAPSYVFGELICEELFLKNPKVIEKYEEFINIPEDKKKKIYQRFSQNNSCLPSQFEDYIENSEKFKHSILSQIFYETPDIKKQRDDYLKLSEDKKYEIYKKLFETNPEFKKKYDEYINLMENSKHAQLFNSTTGKFEFSVGKMDRKKWAPHTALLNDGKIFIMDDTKKAEVYDPKTETFKKTVELNIDPNFKIRQLITLNDGRVFVLFGNQYTIYDPKNDQYSNCKKISMHIADRALKLQNGDIFILGKKIINNESKLQNHVLKNGLNVYIGNYCNWSGAKDIEILNPIEGKDYFVGEINLSRGDYDDFTITMLKNGKVLIVGGQNLENIKQIETPIKYVRRAEIFNPQTNTSKIVGKMQEGRIKHKAILLDDGTVLIIGGVNSINKKSAELFLQNETK